ncbi:MULTISPECIES: hypothetical protein [unclassified Streptomyces]|uniref:hypothetical protein n=1 Tax=unclassified Streptomyces TaxID=2593676 RepID=UPI003651AA2F
MTTSPFSSSRCRRIAAVASALMLIAVPTTLLALVVGASMPESWWPRTGQAFAADTHSGSTPPDPCELIAGPAKKYCERGTSSTTSSAHQAHRDGANAAWMAVPAVAGLAALVVWRRRGAAGHGRH